MSYKIDDLGTYNDEQLPEGVSLPLRIDESNESISGDDNAVLLRYAGQTAETSVLLQEKRKAEFVVKLANGDVIVRKDKAGNNRVFKRTSQKVINGKIVIEFEEVKVPVPV